MTEQETRGKIFNIIREFNVKKRRYSTHTEPSDDEELADALIAAGIGDLKEHRIFAGKDGSIKQLYSGEEVEKIVKERKELKDELRWSCRISAKDFYGATKIEKLYYALIV